MTLDKFLHSPRMDKPETMLNSNIRTRGFTMEDHIVAPDGFKEVEEWCLYPYRVVWINAELKTTITYCEGDITVVQCQTEKRYDKEIADAKAFYEKE